MIKFHVFPAYGYSIEIYFISSSNSLQLYLVISDVNAGGIIMIGVRDGRFDESVFVDCNLSVAGVSGLGIEELAAG